MKLTAEFKLRMAGLLSVFLFAQPLYASFEPLPVGGRAAGMGEAYSAIVDDVFSLYYNPAGVLQVNRPEVGTYYSKLYSGLTDNSNVNRMFFGYAQPFGKGGKLGGIGASYMALNLSGLYKEEALGVTYGQEFHHLWNVAGTLKILKKQIGSDPYSSNAIDPVTGTATGTADPLLAKSKASSAIGLDLGMQYRLTQAYALGIAARNINAPDLAIGTQKDAAPAVLTFALARKMRNGSLDLEIMNWKTTDNNMRFSVGGEHWFKGGLGIRAGGGFGSRNYSSASFGASYKMESIQFDYATVLPLQGIQGTLGIQQISFVIRLGKPPVDPIETQLLKEKEERIKAETEARYAKAERDRLKKQLYALTEAQTQAQKDKEAESARRALEEAKQNEAAQAALAGKSTGDRTALTRYTAELADYNTKVSQGATLMEKKRMLEKIYGEFNGTSVDISTINRELKNLKQEEARAKKDFELSMGFYQRLSQQGSSVEERRGMLERIIQKYKGTGIDIGSAEEELKNLK